jgi:hypothetical protein
VQVDDRGHDSVQVAPALQADPAKAFNPETIRSDLNEVLSLRLQPGPELQADRSGALDPNTIHSSLDGIVIRNLTPGLQLQADRGRALNPAAIHKNVDDSLTRGLPPLLVVNLDTVETPPASWLAEVDSGLIGKYRSKKLSSTNDELYDDDEANTGWKLVPFYGVAMLFLLRQCFSRQGRA